MFWGVDVGRSLETLHESARVVQGHDVSFKVHYWGANSAHFDNLLHTHSFFEICFVVRGSGRYIDEGTEYPLTDGTLFCSRPQVPHQIRSETGIALLYVAFEFDPRSSAQWETRYAHLQETGAIVVPQASATAAGRTWETLMLCAAENSHPDTLRAIALSLLASFPDAFTKVQGDARRANRPRTNPILERAVLFVRDNLEHSLKLSEVASYLHVSSRHLSRLFKNATNTSYNAYVQEQRLARARTLLTDTELPIKEIAQSCGFTSVHYFTRVFTEQEEASPARFRQAQRAVRASAG